MINQCLLSKKSKNVDYDIVKQWGRQTNKQ